MHITLVYLKAYQLNQHYFDLMNKFRLCDDFFFCHGYLFRLLLSFRWKDVISFTSKDGQS